MQLCLHVCVSDRVEVAFEKAKCQQQSLIKHQERGKEDTTILHVLAKNELGLIFLVLDVQELTGYTIM